jgi:O-antigen ligase
MLKNFFKKLNIGLLFLNIFFLQSYLIRFNVLGYPTNLQEILIFIQASIFLLAVVIDKNLSQTFKNIRNHWVSNTFILLTAISVLTVDVVDNIYFIRHLRFLLMAVVLSFIFIETLRTEKSRIEGLKIMGQGAIIFGIFSAIYNLLGYNVTHDYRLLGPLDAAVYLAYYLAPFFIFFSIQFLEHKKRADLIYAIILGLLILATRSMGTIGGTFIILMLYFFKKGNYGILKSKISKIILSLIAIIVVGTIFYTKILPTIQTNYSSLNERGEIWQVSTRLFDDPLDFVWGIGFGQFQYQYETNAKEILGKNPLDYYVLQPHNIFLLFIFQYGILGIFFLFACIIRTIKNLSIPLLGETHLKVICNFIILYFLLHGIIDTPFFKNDLMFLLILFFELGLNRKIHYLSPDTKSIKTA